MFPESAGNLEGLGLDRNQRGRAAANRSRASPRNTYDCQNNLGCSCTLASFLHESQSQKIEITFRLRTLAAGGQGAGPSGSVSGEGSLQAPRDRQQLFFLPHNLAGELLPWGMDSRFSRCFIPAPEPWKSLTMSWGTRARGRIRLMFWFPPFPMWLISSCCGFWRECLIICSRREPTLYSI